jgi:hypothetical protein
VRRLGLRQKETVVYFQSISQQVIQFFHCESNQIEDRFGGGYKLKIDAIVLQWVAVNVPFVTVGISAWEIPRNVY